MSLRLALILLLLPNLAAAEMRVVDGDTLKLDGTTYRLWGIDAAETHQRCPSNDPAGWPAGLLATDYLRALIGGQPVTCEARTTDRYGRTVAICRAGAVDLGRSMVLGGHAWAFTRYSHDYDADEQTARAGSLGVHAHDCEPPWDWRRTHR